MSTLDVKVFLKEQFETEEQCIAYLEKVRWPKGVRCSNCGHEKISRIQTAGKTGKPRYLYQCLDRNCRYQFSATTGTIFHDSHLPLTKWFAAIAIVSGSKEEVSAGELRRALDVQYRTAQHVLKRIEEALSKSTIELKSNEPAESAEVLQTGGGQRGFVPAVPPESFVASSGVIGEMASHKEMGTPIGNALNIATSIAKMTLRPPLFFVNCISRILS